MAAELPATVGEAGALSLAQMLRLLARAAASGDLSGLPLAVRREVSDTVAGVQTANTASMARLLRPSSGLCRSEGLPDLLEESPAGAALARLGLGRLVGEANKSGVRTCAHLRRSVLGASSATGSIEAESARSLGFDAGGMYSGDVASVDEWAKRSHDQAILKAACGGGSEETAWLCGAVASWQEASEILSAASGYKS